MMNTLFEVELDLSEVIVGYIDNDTDEFSIVETILSQFEIKLRTSSDPNDGKQWIKNNQIHFLICDWKMPIQGDGILLEIRNFEKEIPLLLYSGHGGFRFYTHSDLEKNNIEKLHKLDLSTLPLIIEDLVSKLKNSNPKRFDKIKNSEFLKQEMDEEDIHQDYDYDNEEFGLNKKLIKKYCKYIIADFERILAEGGENVNLTFSESLDLNIIDAIKSLEDLDRNGLKIFDFWITGYLELMRGENE
ncbi:MAG: response regulator [Chitinophagales bacterium]|nr:response regulator [Chitinophagales bacterium]